ncbi:endonuclease [Streptomyces sp. HUCO-GS316]|uniref:endonuclease/exonuclease/phosphatase family protein n=1 Tax=Streptomyces sp. HUCO-GS316 TaxID=2692198 RepID=UPI001370CA58|nr:endonuclease/exonuclease/phosphatase family protein [Streptomyces sp. HUCO-GS316]MXM66639.1 endonuclease [Streptomyces sp. HUCO-GS316]
MTGSTRGPTRRAGLRSMMAAAVAVPLIGTVGASAALHGRPPQESPRHESPPRGRPASAPPLEVMTFNLRVAGTTEPNSWADRRPVMRTLLRRAGPHVIGTQEGQLPQLLDIAADLGPHFDWVGTPGGDSEESVAVFYDTRRLANVEHTTFWLSDTPEVPGSNTWGSAYPRLVTQVGFRDLLCGGREFHVLNTHLDHKSRYARTRAATLIAERITALAPSLPVVLAGDFNVYAHADPVYDTLLGAGLVDTWDAAAERGPLYGTFHGYRPLVPDGDRIDWILATPGVTAHRARVNTFSRDGQYPSDHLPVQASLTLG